MISILSALHRKSKFDNKLIVCDVKVLLQIFIYLSCTVMHESNIDVEKNGRVVLVIH